MSGRREPRSKHQHDPALERHKKSRQDLHPGLAVGSSSGSGSGSDNLPQRESRADPRSERERRQTSCPMGN